MPPTSGLSLPLPPPEEIACEILAALDAHKQIAPFSQRVSGLDLPAAYAATAALRRLREARGERPVGRKIGFTNRALWTAVQGVRAELGRHVRYHRACAGRRPRRL